MDPNNALLNSNGQQQPQVSLDQLIDVLQQMLVIVKTMKSKKDDAHCEAIVEKLTERYQNLKKEDLVTLLTPCIKVRLGPVFCQGYTKQGRPCKRRPMRNQLYC